MGIFGKSSKRDNYEIRETPVSTNNLISSIKDYWKKEGYKEVNIESSKKNSQGLIKRARIQLRYLKSMGVKEFVSKKVPFIEIDIKTISKNKCSAKFSFDFSKNFRKKSLFWYISIYIIIFIFILTKDIASLSPRNNLDIGQDVLITILLGLVISCFFVFLSILTPNRWKTKNAIDKFWKFICKEYNLSSLEIARIESKLYLPPKSYFPIKLWTGTGLFIIFLFLLAIFSFIKYTFILIILILLGMSPIIISSYARKAQKGFKTIRRLLSLHYSKMSVLLIFILWWPFVFPLIFMPVFKTTPREYMIEYIPTSYASWGIIGPYLFWIILCFTLVYSIFSIPPKEMRYDLKLMKELYKADKTDFYGKSFYPIKSNIFFLLYTIFLGGIFWFGVYQYLSYLEHLVFKKNFMFGGYITKAVLNYLNFFHGLLVNREASTLSVILSSKMFFLILFIPVLILLILFVYANYEYKSYKKDDNVPREISNVLTRISEYSGIKKPRIIIKNNPFLISLHYRRIYFRKYFIKMDPHIIKYFTIDEITSMLSHEIGHIKNISFWSKFLASLSTICLLGKGFYSTMTNSLANEHNADLFSLKYLQSQNKDITPLVSALTKSQILFASYLMEDGSTQPITFNTFQPDKLNFKTEKKKRKSIKESLFEFYRFFFKEEAIAYLHPTYGQRLKFIKDFQEKSRNA